MYVSWGLLYGPTLFTHKVTVSPTRNCCVCVRAWKRELVSMRRERGGEAGAVENIGCQIDSQEVQRTIKSAHAVYMSKC